MEDCGYESTHAQSTLKAENNAPLLGQKYMTKSVLEALTSHYWMHWHSCQTARNVRIDSNTGKVLKGIYTSWRKSETKPWQRGREHRKYKPLAQRLNCSVYYPHANVILQNTNHLHFDLHFLHLHLLPPHICNIFLSSIVNACFKIQLKNKRKSTILLKKPWNNKMWI